MVGVRSFTGGSPFAHLPSGMDDFSLAKVECLKGDGKYRPFETISQDSFRKPSRFACTKRVFLKLSNQIPCLTPSHLALSFSRAKKKSIPEKDMGKKKLTPLEDGQKKKAFPCRKEQTINFKFHFYRGRRDINRQ